MRRRAGTSAWGRGWVRRIALVMTAVVTVTTLGACVPGNDARSESRELRLYTGAIPEPAALDAAVTTGQEMPEPPTPPTDFSDEDAVAEFEAQMQKYTEEAQKYTEALQNSSGDAVSFAQRVGELVEATAKSDEASVAAWQSLLVAAGIAVGYGDEAVSVSGMEGAGIPMTMGELRLHALLGASEMRIPLAELAHMIGGFGVFDETDLAQALYDDLHSQSGTGFGVVFFMLDPDAFTTIRYGEVRSVPLDEVTLTAAQAALILRKLSIDLLVVAEETGGIDAVLAESSGAAGAHAAAARAAEIVPGGWRVRAAAEGPCGTEETPWEAEGRRNIGKGAGAGFGQVIGQIPGFEGAKLALAAAQAALAIASVLAKIALMQSDFSMGDAPLVRTKDRTAGERREIAVALKYPADALEDVRKCLSALLAPFGVDLSDHSSGAASGVDVEFRIKNNRLEFSSERSGTAVYRQQTAQNGMVTFPVVGRPQAERLPSGAEPEEVTAPVEVHANIEGSDLVKDLKAAAWDAIGPSVAGILSNVASRMKLVAFTWDVPVRDWTLVGDFDVVLTGQLWGHSATNRGGTAEAPCGTYVIHMSTSAQGTVESTQSSRVTAHYVTEVVDGSPLSGLVFYPKGSSLDEVAITEDGAELSHLQVGYSATKSEAAPGVEPMPPHYSEPGIGGCGDGNGNYVPPQPDCGAREYPGLATLVVNDGTLRVLGNEMSQQWFHCGWKLSFADPLSPPASMKACASADPGGGEVPSMDSVFNERGWFEVTGSLNCSRDGEGTLSRFTFDWTLKFCRVNDEGRSSGC